MAPECSNINHIHHLNFNCVDQRFGVFSPVASSEIYLGYREHNQSVTINEKRFTSRRTNRIIERLFVHSETDRLPSLNPKQSQQER